MLDTDAGPGLEHPPLPRGQVDRARVVAVERTGGRGGGCVELADVVADHPGREHLGAQRLQRVADHLQPPRRDSGGVDVVEPRGDLVLDQVVERGGLEVVTSVDVLHAVGGRDRPAVLAVVPLVPPAVEHREVQSAVERRLHAGGAAGLIGAQRVVEPDVAARVEGLGHGDVVVGQEDDAVPDLGVVGEPDDVLDELLAAVVGRVRLAGDHQLDGALGVEQQPLEPLGVAHHQRQALVRRCTPREAHGQHVGVQRIVDPGELCAGRTPLGPRLGQASTGVLDEPLTQHPLGRPHRLTGDRVHDVPEGVDVLGVRRHAGARGELEDLAADPGGAVHAVGDGPDRHLGLVEGRPEPLEHPARDVPVQLGDAVGALGQAEAHDGHVEHRRVTALVVLGAQRQDPFDGDARAGAGVGEVLLDERPGEPVDPGGDRRVRGEHRRGASDLERGVEVQARTGGVDGELADALQPQEPRVTLVGVEDLGRLVPGDARERPQRLDPADAEQQLLAQPVLGVAAVEAVGHVDVLLAVALHVGVEHEQRHASDPRHPDPGQQVRAAGHRDGDGRGLPGGLAQHRDRELVGVEHGVGLLLPALAGERLLEVTVSVEQADADDRDAEVAGGLEVVAGQDAEATGVLRQHRRDPELRGEVADRPWHAGVGRSSALEPPVPRQVGVQVRHGLVEQGPEGLVRGQRREALPADRTQQAHGVAPGLLPQVGVDGGEHVLGRRVPGPAQVERQVAERRQLGGQDGADGEASDGTHARTLTRRS